MDYNLTPIELAQQDVVDRACEFISNIDASFVLLRAMKQREIDEWVIKCGVFSITEEQTAQRSIQAIDLALKQIGTVNAIYTANN